MKEKDNLYVKENHEQGGNGTNKKKKTKKMSGEHETRDLGGMIIEESNLGSHSLGYETKEIALPTNENHGEGIVAVKKDKRKKKKISNVVESIEENHKSLEEISFGEIECCEEGGVNEKKKRKKKKKKKIRSDATENVEVSKVELDEESMQDLPVVVKPKPAPKIAENCKEMILEEKKMNRKKKKKRHGSPESNDLDKNTLEAMPEFPVEGKVEVALPTAANGNSEAISERNKIKRKKKRYLLSESIDMDRKALKEAMRELMLKVKPASALQTEENHKDVDTKMKMIKRKKKEKRHISPECTEMDKKLSEDNLQDLSVKIKPEAVQQAVENHEEVNAEQKKVKKNKKKNKKKKKQLSSCENGDGNQSQLKRNLEMTVINLPGNALLTSQNYEEMSAVKKKEMKKGMTAHEHDGRHQKMLEEGSLELQLPVDRDLKASLLADENHVSMMEDKSTVCKVETSDDASVHDLSTKQLVEKSGVSSSELLREVKQCPIIEEENKEISVTNCKKEKEASNGDAIKDFGFQDENNKECNSTQIVLALRKSAPISSRRKLLILDLNGLLLDVVMVVPRGYKADKRIGQKAAFKRPFCDDFLKFCFERFEVGVWTSRTKRNMDDVVDFLMADMKHKLFFCWDQSHCTMTGFNTIDNMHKPLVFKELRKLWDKHEPSLPWEKGEYNESNTLLLDDSPYKALLNPPNTAIFPYSYGFQDMNDNSLGPEGDIRLYLEGLATAEDVQKYVKQHPFGQHAITNTSPSWGFYYQVFEALKSNSINLGNSVSPYIPQVFIGSRPLTDGSR